MTEDLQNPAVDTAQPAETVAEQGTVVSDKVDTAPAETEPGVTTDVPDKTAQKQEMRKNQLENIEKNAKELEQASGKKLEDLLMEIKERPAAEPQETAKPDKEEGTFSDDLEALVEETIIPLTAR